MIQVNVHEAKTRLSELLAAVERGEEVVIARAGTPVARLVLASDLAASKPHRRPSGFWEGQVEFDQDAWDATDREIAEEFERSLSTPVSPDESTS